MSAIRMTPTVYSVEVGGAEKVRIERRIQRGWGVKWAVVDPSGFCLTLSGDWEYEAIPSSRTDEFLARTRFGDPDYAFRVFCHTQEKGGSDAVGSTKT